ncbi:DUF6678 family protein [Chryseobacterium caseinilyticum]|uniref:Uncharacterized protein n=1 Tax=Chryseobacterium caseinilyticum TaxID=2771428 RepID=A0ABR8Z9R3_9FLAO|nr:DUF6678 family protein [Chryseobacterium caseinilyticum]MBD8081972.1 hypothetical protein [Chryseobacterium caseinilyticum]
MKKTEKQKPYFDIFGDPNLSEREKYKYYTQHDIYSLQLKENVRKVGKEKGLSSVINETRWLELQSSIVKLPFAPPYIEKLILENKTFKEVQISDAPSWLSDWNPFYQEGMSLFFAIEYIKIRPFYFKYNGRLTVATISDEGVQFAQLLNELHIPYEDDNGTFTIY